MESRSLASNSFVDALIAFPVSAPLSGGRSQVRMSDARPQDEADLIAKAAAGERAAFRTLYLRHRDVVARIVFRMLGGAREQDRRGYPPRRARNVSRSTRGTVRSAMRASITRLQRWTYSRSEPRRSAIVPE